VGPQELVFPLTIPFPGFPNKPGVSILFSNGSFVTEDTRSIPQMKLAKNLEINLARFAANQTFFMFQNKQIAVDALSRSDIDAISNKLSLTGTFPTGFPHAWKAMNNTFVGIPDVPTWISFIDAMVNQGTANFIKSEGLKAQLNIAQTPQQIEAIQW
jgi:hypothetical protein